MSVQRWREKLSKKRLVLDLRENEAGGTPWTVFIEPNEEFAIEFSKRHRYEPLPIGVGHALSQEDAIREALADHERKLTDARTNTKET